jgi:prevent-host-death family protein
MIFKLLYASGVEVSVSALRANLSESLKRVRAGEEIVVTERGVPVARVVGVNAASVIERLTVEGVISPSQQSQRPTAKGRARVRASGPVADLVSELRD